jgi:hypothetical protein
MINNQSRKTNIIASIVSNIFNPGILAILILLVAVFKSNMTLNESIAWYMAILILNGLIPGLIYLFFTQKGYVFDDTLHNREVHKERIVIFGVFLAVATIELLILVMLGNLYQPLYATLVGGIVAIIVAGGVSYFWKVSMHSSIVTFFVLMIILIFGFNWWPVAFIIPLTWWSRLVLYRHTIWQLIVGMSLSLMIALGTFWFFGLL